jgi:hypothetical protein
VGPPWVLGQSVAETTNEGRTYIALLREGEGNERAVSFESPTGEETQVGDEITVDGAEWRVLAIEQEEPPWAGVLVCERADDGGNRSERPSRLEDEPTPPADEPSFLEDDLPLHLRVLRAILEGETRQKRIDHALALANEVYELEANEEFED